MPGFLAVLMAINWVLFATLVFKHQSERRNATNRHMAIQLVRRTLPSNISHAEESPDEWRTDWVVRETASGTYQVKRIILPDQPVNSEWVAYTCWNIDLATKRIEPVACGVIGWNTGQPAPRL